MEYGVIQAENDPLAYPWEKPEYPGIMQADNYRMMEARSARRISTALVRSDRFFHSIERDAQEHQRAVPDDRYLVAAIGSNASLDVMRNKFARRGINTPSYMPHAPATITNLRIVPMAGISARGYIAATVTHAAGVVTPLWVSWLDRKQFLALDSTEPGYTCRWISADDYPVEVFATRKGLTADEPTERPAGIYLYDADEGALAFDGIAPDLLTQTELFARLAAIEGFESLFGGDPREVVTRFADEVTRADFHRLLAERDMIIPPNITGTPHPNITERVTYGNTPDVALQHAYHTSHAFRAVGTRDSLDRDGEQWVVVCTDEAANLGSHAEIAAYDAELGGASRPGAIVAVHAADDLPFDTVEVDQMVRDALGVKCQEGVVLKPATPPERWYTPVADAIAAPRYVLVRAHVADHSNAETDVALLDPQTMKMLGLDEGDIAVLEGPTDADGRVRTARMRVCSVSDHVLEKRHELSSGDLYSRYASSDLGLGVYPDLPPLMIDRSARFQLGIADAPLSPVRIRASRRQKLLTELRELMLVLAVAVIGIVSIADSLALSVLLLVLVVIVTLLLSVSKVRARLGRTGRRRAQR